MSEFDAAPADNELTGARPAEPPRVGDEVPEADAIEQQADVVPEEEPPLEEVSLEVEANPADVEEQRRAVPLSEDDEEA